MTIHANLPNINYGYIYKFKKNYFSFVDTLNILMQSQTLPNNLYRQAYCRPLIQIFSYFQARVVPKV